MGGTSLFEWLGESFNPGPVGSVNVGRPRRGGWARGVVLARGVIAVVLLGVVAGFLLAATGGPDVRNAAIIAGVTMAYVVMGFFAHPRPDMSNLGWLGGLANNPFRLSDDMNRGLLFFSVALLPGRFVAESIVDLTRLLLAARRGSETG